MLLSTLNDIVSIIADVRDTPDLDAVLNAIEDPGHQEGFNKIIDIHKKTQNSGHPLSGRKNIERL